MVEQVAIRVYMNNKNINLIKEKYKDLLEDDVEYALYHDPTTSQLTQYPRFTIKVHYIFFPLDVPSSIQSLVSSYSEDFIPHMINNVEDFINNVCTKALNKRLNVI